jgi:sorbitol/mannitol transport system permease protein
VATVDTPVRTDTQAQGAPRQDPPASGRQRWARRLPLLPGLVYIIILTQIPFLFTLFYSFQHWNLYRPGQRGFAGLENYRFVLGSPTFRTGALNTVVLTAGAVLVALVLGLVLALLLNRAFRGRAVARTLLITPFLVMPVATALMWKNMVLHPVFGLWTFLMRPFFGTVDWVAQYPMAAIIATVAWQWTPFMMLILLAGLQSQDEETMEAARVDGAGPLAVFRYLTWSHLRPYAELGILLGSIFIVQTFDPIFIITQGGPGTATTNLPYFIYLQAFRALDIGQAAASAIVVVIATIVIATFALRVMSNVFKLADYR